MMPAGAGDGSDRVALADVGRRLVRGWPVIGAAVALCLAGGGAVLMWAPRVWTATASVLVKDATPIGGALVEQMSGALGAAGAGAASALLGGRLGSTVETDMALLKSRELIGEVVDSLGLVVTVSSPNGMPPGRAVAATEVEGPFRPLTVRLVAAGGGVRVRARGVDTVVAAGGTARLPAGTLRLAAQPVLPAELRIRDREETITRLVRRVGVERLGGDLIGISWPASDSLSAPEAANVLVRRFLVRRRGVDRSINAKKLDFVAAQIDTVNRSLDAALRRLRDFQQEAHAVDMPVAAKAYLESLLRLREQREPLVMEEQALAALTAQLRSHAVQPRQLGAYPQFLRSPAISELLSRIGELDAERAGLLQQQRREGDPRVAGIRASVASLEAELEPLVRTYTDAVTEQRATLDKEIASVAARLDQLPDQVERSFRFSADVERLSRTSLALNAQRVELQLATVGEGGEARAVDVARPQWRRSFPRPAITLLAAGIAGLALGAALVLGGVGARRGAGTAA